MALVLAVHRSGSHTFSKHPEDAIVLVPGLGVQGDAHAGVTVKHRSRVRSDPSAANLRQVHLIHAELFDELTAAGFPVWPGELGEEARRRAQDFSWAEAARRFESFLVPVRRKALGVGADSVTMLSSQR